jgi:hypothetical protein
VSRTWLKRFPGVFRDFFVEQKRAAAFVLPFGRSIDMLSFEADGLVGLSMSELILAVVFYGVYGITTHLDAAGTALLRPLSTGLKRAG